jgi:hypothetical protein
MCEIIFENVEDIYCKIITFEVKKRTCYVLCKTRSAILYPLDLKLLHYLKLRFFILYWEVELKIYKIKKLKN